MLEVKTYNDIEKEKIENVERELKELKLLESFFRKNGLKLFSYNFENKKN